MNTLTDVAPLLICPVCQSKTGLKFTEVPDQMRTWHEPGDFDIPREHVHYWGKCYDVECTNCSFEFTVPMYLED